LLSKQSLNDVSNKEKVSIQTLNTWFKPLWNAKIKIKKISIDNQVIHIDGKYIDKNLVILIASIKNKVIYFSFVKSENYLSWKLFLLNLKGCPFAIVCDGQRGMLKAIREVFIKTIIQRCYFHVISYCLTKLTRTPKLVASKDLRLLVLNLKKINYKIHLDKWLNKFNLWIEKYQDYLNEKTYFTIHFTKTNHSRWFYTHKNLRASFSHLNNAIKNLFNYIDYSNIQRTNNYLEGGINSQIQHLIVNHRGLNLEKRKYIISLYLNKKTNTKL